MRLIDADELEKTLETAINMQMQIAVAIGIEGEEYVEAEIKAYSDILQGIKETPAAECLPSAQPERGQAEKRCPVGGVDRSGEVDRITIEAANETPFWLGIFETEPERLVDVRMSYSDLKCLLDCFDHVRKFLKGRQGAELEDQDADI